MDCPEAQAIKYKIITAQNERQKKFFRELYEAHKKTCPLCK
jgi:hypothetical protein